MTDSTSFMIEIPHSLAVHCLSKLTDWNDYNHHLLAEFIARGNRREQERLKLQAEAAKRLAAEQAVKPLSVTGTQAECLAEINRLRRLYNLSWQFDCDLVSVANLFWRNAGGELIAHTAQEPWKILSALEGLLAEGRLGEPFVGPLYEPEYEEGDEA